MLVLLLGTGAAAEAQTGTIVGTVTDVQRGAVLEGALVTVLGPGLSGLTGPDGRFQLLAVPVGSHIVRAARVGYGAVELSVPVPAGGTVAVDFALPTRPFDLDEIVVTGAGRATRQREVGHSSVRLRVEEIGSRRVTVSDLLQGAASGVEVTGSSAEAGQGRQIRLRGNRSLSLSNQPIIYVDGVRMMEGGFPSELSGTGVDGFFTGAVSAFTANGANISTTPLDMVSVGDIERIEIVKGPAATTLLGTGAGNGVIQVFTRRGRPGGPRWTAAVVQGTGWVRPFGANGLDYFNIENFLRDAWWGDGYEGGAYSKDCVTDDERWKDVNSSPEGGCSWPGAQWYQTYRLSAEGGLGELTYYVSGEYQNDTYALPLDRLHRYATRVNLNAPLTPRLELQASAAYTNLWTRNTTSGNSVGGILLTTMRGRSSYLGVDDPRDIALVLDNPTDQDIDRLTLGLTATFEQSPTLSHRLTLGGDHSVQDLRSVVAIGYPVLPEGGLTTRGWKRGLGTIDYAVTRVFAANRDLRSTLSVGGQLLADDITSELVTSECYPPSGVTAHADADSMRSFEHAASTSTAGAFAQNVTGYRDRYFLTLGLRADRHEVRGESFVRVNPKVGGTWVASDESFWPTSLGALRLRVAYGRASAAPSPFMRTEFPPVGVGRPDPNALGRVPRPEQVTEWEAGLDAAGAGGRLFFGFTWYRQTTSDALVTVTDLSDPPEERMDRLENIGTIQNRGIELEVDAALLRVRNWGLELGFELTTNRSELLDLGGAPAFRDMNGWLVEGQPVPVGRGVKVADPGAVNGPWSQDRYVLDENGDPALVVRGPQLPTHYLASTLHLRMPWGVTLSARGEYRGGNVRHVSPDGGRMSGRSPLCIPHLVDPEAVRGLEPAELKPDTPDLWQERCTSGQDFWFDADYFKLRNVHAAIPVRFAFPSAVEEATLTVSLSNAWTWYREVPWWDLEILADEGANDDGLGTAERVPAPTTVTFGVRVRF